MLVRLKGHRDCLQVVLQIVALAFLQIIHHALCQPFEKIFVVLRKGVKNPVNALGDKRLPVQFHLIGGELPDLPGEGLEGLLEKAVDRADGKRAVVVQDVAQHGLRTPAKSVLGVEHRDKFIIIRRILRRNRKQMQLLQNPAFHLVGGLVGECHRKNMPVRISLLVRQQKSYVCFGQIEGLTRSGRRFHDSNHFISRK